VDPERLIFLDETATTTDMARRYGRSRLGERLVAAVPQGHWKTTTFVAGLRQTRAASSRRWCSPGDRRRIPRLRRAVPGAGALEPGDVVLLDNLVAHKVDVGQALAAAGTALLFLPPYSPDFNPIEQLLAKLKCAAAPHRGADQG
jgi:hypothetical protein